MPTDDVELVVDVELMMEWAQALLARLNPPAEIFAWQRDVVTSMPATTERTNRYEAHCTRCHALVAAGSGILYRQRTVDGREAWAVRHPLGTCLEQVPPPPPTTPWLTTDLPAGYYAVPSLGRNDLDFYRVARRPSTRGGGDFIKVSKVIGGRANHQLHRASAQAALDRIAANGSIRSARVYAREIGRCCRCNRHLTDETSRQRSMGPDCYGQSGGLRQWLRGTGVAALPDSPLPAVGWVNPPPVPHSDELMVVQPPMFSELGTGELL